MEKKTGYGILVIAAVIVWMFAILWAPFGKPLPIWHVVNGIVLAVGIVMHYVEAKKADNTKVPQ